MPFFAGGETPPLHEKGSLILTYHHGAAVYIINTKFGLIVGDIVARRHNVNVAVGVSPPEQKVQINFISINRMTVQL